MSLADTERKSLCVILDVNEMSVKGKSTFYESNIEPPGTGVAVNWIKERGENQSW